jgi:hypothetical protein
MRDRAKQTVQKVDGQLAAKELEMLIKTGLDAENLGPGITGHALYQELCAVIEDATRNNMSVVQLETRVRAMGDEAWALTGKIIDTLK